MTDLISRADAIEAVNMLDIFPPTKDTVARELMALPSAEAYFTDGNKIAEWIPCSERLPSEDGRYLVCMDWEYDNMEVLRWADGWNCHRGYDGKISRESEIDGEDIVAWMPLPKPYREDGE